MYNSNDDMPGGGGGGAAAGGAGAAPLRRSTRAAAVAGAERTRGVFAAEREPSVAGFAAAAPRLLAYSAMNAAAAREAEAKAARAAAAQAAIANMTAVIASTSPDDLDEAYSLASAAGIRNPAADKLYTGRISTAASKLLYLENHVPFEKARAEVNSLLADKNAAVTERDNILRQIFRVSRRHFNFLVEYLADKSRRDAAAAAAFAQATTAQRIAAATTEDDIADLLAGISIGGYRKSRRHSRKHHKAHRKSHKRSKSHRKSRRSH